MSPASRRATAAKRAAAARKAAARSTRSARGPSSAARPSASIARAAGGNPNRRDLPAGIALARRTTHKEHKPDHEQQNNESEGPGTARATRPGLLLGGPPLEILGIAGQQQNKIVNAVLDGTDKVASAKPRQDGILDDQARHRIRDGALEPVPDLDPHPSLVGCHQQDRAVVLALLADAPGAAEPVTVVGDVIALQRAQRHDDQLVAGLAFELLELALDATACSRIQDLGLVDHAPCESRECGLSTRIANEAQFAKRQTRTTRSNLKAGC